MPPGAAGKRHFHQAAQQFFFILWGTAAFEPENETITILAREGLHILPEQRHRISNQSDTDLLFTVIPQPSRRGARHQTDQIYTCYVPVSLLKTH